MPRSRKKDGPAKGQQPAMGQPPPRESRGASAGTRAGAAGLRTVVEGAREFWGRGDLQRAGRQLAEGNVDLASALRSLAGPARELLDRAAEEHHRIVEEDRPAERQLAEALNERSRGKPRSVKRGGKNETVVRGVIRDADGEPVPGLVVEARTPGAEGRSPVAEDDKPRADGRAQGAAWTAVVAVDVTDADGRYQLVLPNEALGDVEAVELSMELGLDWGAVLLRPERTFEAVVGTATDHDLVLPAESAEQARHALAAQDEMNAARVQAHHRRGALLALERQLLDLTKELADELDAHLRT